MAETIKIWCQRDGLCGALDVTGRSVWLRVGAERVQCFIHDLRLTHYASGFKLAELNPATGIELTDEAAQMLLDDVIEAHCVDAAAFLSLVAERPILNGGQGHA